MYAIYGTKQTESHGEYRFKRETCFFGNRSGLIPKLLRQQLPPDQMEPHSWHLPVARILGEGAETFIINLKPNNKDAAASRSLYELLDVWGFPASGWTPAMLRLRGLVVDGEPRVDDPNGFDLDFIPENRTIYSFLYFVGGVRDGDITGKWTAPRASPTNSALLWPEVLRYFVDQIKEATPEVLKLETV